ncbi:alpha/beta hydrolase [Actinoplanes sp. L3-i22]|uniref:alpha/beta hydrolase n=1 Tax=Actinoplanes sp. L3-i22 TaxID=2836373 RepID=UPI001C746D04|nr:alpha/beta hydrolase [Actinoplanes sp. L3-i22]BCY12673.1 lipase [Actinoplanes sp. L3-i22]
MITEHREVVFARRPGFRPLALDLYVPANPQALCVYLHGGGWRVGSRTEGPGNVKTWKPDFFRYVASTGLAIASVDYRLSAEAQFPAQPDDVTAAIDFLAAHRADFGVTTPRTVIWGVSAGGHLAALAALTPPSRVAPGEPAPVRPASGQPAPVQPAPGQLAPGQPAPEEPAARISAAVCWYPVTDLDALSKDIAEAGGHPDRSAESREGAFLGAALDDVPDLAAAASPVHHVHPGAPPFLFLHGDADKAVPPHQSERLATALRAAGAKATVELVPGAGHMFPELDEPATRAVTDRSIRFLLDHAS